MVNAIRSFRILTIVLLLFVGAFQQASADCFVSYSSSGERYKSTGDSALDAAMNGEASNLASVFGVKPALYILNDSQVSNALANCQDGTVSFGYRLLTEELWQMDHGTLAVAGIMAHEFAHIYQCAKGVSLSGRDRELEADYLAGWYLKNTKAVYGLDVSGFARSLWSKGDYNFHSSSHHGTPDQRVAAMAAGFADGSSYASTALKNAGEYLAGGSSSGSSTPSSCSRKVACTHVVECQHTTSCQHPVTTMETIPCQHVVMTPYGPMTVHQADVTPVTVPAHAYDVMHAGGDTLHAYDVETYACSD